MESKLWACDNICVEHDSIIALDISILETIKISAIKSLFTETVDELRRLSSKILQDSCKGRLSC